MIRVVAIYRGVTGDSEQRCCTVTRRWLPNICLPLVRIAILAHNLAANAGGG
jgi:hypothetical protein